VYVLLGGTFRVTDRDYVPELHIKHMNLKLT
jgi:hypothetical protein